MGHGGLYSAKGKRQPEGMGKSGWSWSALCGLGIPVDGELAVLRLVYLTEVLSDGDFGSRHFFFCTPYINCTGWPQPS